MRNPFKRRRRLEGATADWDDSQHVERGDHVAIPEDQMPAEWLERMRGVRVFDMEGRQCVCVNLDAAKAEMVAWIEGMQAEDVDRLGESEHSAMTKETVNNPAHWVREDEDPEPDAEYAFFEIDLVTGQLVFDSEGSD